ncbi:hypothetical protein ACKWTF_007136 [Chironomus riparius]
MASMSFRPSTSGANFEKVNIPCRFYPGCRFGNNCKFLHDDATSFEATPTINNNIAQSILLSSSSSANNLNPQAPIFVPTIYKQDFDSNFPPKSYADVVNANRDPSEQVTELSIYPADDPTQICPFLMKSGICRYETCSYAHGEMCEMCGKFCLDPYNVEQRKKHEKDCISAHEREMELAFSIQRSKEKTCGICFEIVWEKEGREQRFGILPNCNHCFCLECIRTWRQAKQFDNKIIRSCPECRICSDFVCPSSFWCDSAEEKEKLISKYKNALSEKDCKYFKKGQGTCPFGNKCFYRHCLMDGKKVDVGEPTRTRALNSLGHLENLPVAHINVNLLLSLLS